MQSNNIHSQTTPNHLEESLLNTLIPNEILEIVFDQIVNQKSQPLSDISSILLTCKRWKNVLKANPCISLLQTLFQITHSDRFTTTPPSECIIIPDKKKKFTSQELKLIDQANKEKNTFEKLLLVDSELFHSDSLFLSLLNRYLWDPEVCKNSANQRIRMIAENQLSILNSLISGTDEEKLAVIKNDFIEKFYLGGEVNQRQHEAQTSVISTLKKFRNLNDKSVFIQIAHYFGSCVFDIDESLQKDREVVLAAVQRTGPALAYADKSLRKDREIVLAAVKQDGHALFYAEESLRKDREIVLAAVQRDGYALAYANKSLQKDREVVLAAVKQYGCVIEYADESLQKDRDIVLAAVKRNGSALQYADESLRKDRDIVLAAVQQDGRALQYADESLRKDQDIVLAAVKQDGEALQYADESLRKDRKIVLAAVKQNGWSFQFADKSLKKDQEMMLVFQDRIA